MAETKTLAELADGVEAVVVSMPSGDNGLMRLREMGLLPKSKIHIVRRNVLGDPLEIAVRRSFISVRKADAERILVQEISK